MMGCKSCSVAIGTTININIIDWAGCLTCNASVLSLFPREGTYHGKKDGYHIWHYKSPLICPSCGAKSDGIRFECHNGGGSLELPLLLELPIQEKKQ
jgi:hypothetical protein